MSKAPIIVVLIVLLASVNCITTGRQFTLGKKENRKYFLIGKTTKSQVLEEFGPPQAEAAIMKHGLSSEIYDWYFTVNTGPTHQRRRLSIEFKDSNVHSYSFTSSFLSDSTEFNEEAAKGIKSGATPKELVKILGFPSGEVSVPNNFLSEDLVPKSDYAGISRIWIYAYAEVKTTPFQLPEDAYSYSYFFFNEAKQVVRILHKKKR